MEDSFHKEALRLEEHTDEVDLMSHTEIELPLRYAVITPVRDEEEHIEKTIQSMIHQTVLPLEWVIVDDGSRDKTFNIIKSYSNLHPWIHTAQRLDRGYRKTGGGVIDAFYEGYGLVKTTGWDYIVKFDGDLVFGRTYFEDCLNEFKKDRKLGIGGGTIYNNIDGKYVIEKCQQFHVRGATKIYRRDCWLAIGELVRAPGWDTLDEIKAKMLGWETRSFINIPLFQERITGGVDGQWKNCVKNGTANYISGYHPLFMGIKCIKRLFQKPYIIGSIGLLAGFIKGYTDNIPKIIDQQLIDYIRNQQLRAIMFRESIWKW